MTKSILEQSRSSGERPNLTWPCDPSMLTRHTSPETLAPPRGRLMASMLVIDDEPVILTLLRTDRGYGPARWHESQPHQAKDLFSEHV